MVLAAAVLLAAAFNPARAQSADGLGFEQMEQFAPMLNAMKRHMGKKRFAKLMQTMGPMMSEMMEGQGSGGFGGGNFGIGGFGGYGGFGNFDAGNMMRLINADIIAGMVSLFDDDRGRRPRRKRR